MNMKNILRLMGVLTLTTGAANSVVACGQETGVAMDAALSKQLGLTDDKGEGTLAPSFDVSKPSEVTWTVTAAADIKGSALLVADDKAANQSCFDFIKNVLKVNPKTGFTLADGVFDKAALDAITSEVSNVTPTLKQTEDKKDYAVTGGTFSFQFKNGDTKLGDVYGIKLKVDATKGVVEDRVKAVANKITATDTDVADNDKIMFKVGDKVPNTAKPGVAITINDKADAGKQFASLNKITDLKITAELGEVIHAGESWAAGDKLEIVYKAGDVTFEAKTTFELK